MSHGLFIWSGRSLILHCHLLLIHIFLRHPILSTGITEKISPWKIILVIATAPFILIHWSIIVLHDFSIVYLLPWMKLEAIRLKMLEH